MTIARLDTPLRVTWDLHGPAGGVSATAALIIAERLVDAGLFYVTLQRRPLAHTEISGILAVFSEGGVQVQATFNGTEEEWRGIEALAFLPAICVDAGAFLATGSEGEWSALRQVIERLRKAGAHPDLLMVPDRQNLRLLPQLCTFCRSVGVTRIKLPNTPVDASFPGHSVASLPEIPQLDALRAVVTNAVAFRTGLSMEVHDLFLWEILFPGERDSGRAEYGGCQAANSLAHIDGLGMVHPCSSWPAALGSLLEVPFVEIWQQEARFAILDKIGKIPDGCAGCGDYLRCFGGCRGLVATLGTGDDGRDLLCSGCRSSLPNGCD